MSSGEEELLHGSKRPKLQRACDTCRRRKIKCDGLQMPGRRCSRCVAQGIECFYTESGQRRTYPSSYVHRLESRLARMEKLVNKLHPDERISTEVGPRQLGIAASSSHVGTPETTRQSDADHTSGSRLVVTPQTPVSSESFDGSDGEDDVPRKIIDEFYNLSIVDKKVHRYHGKSSGLAFLNSAMDSEQKYAQQYPYILNRLERPKPWLQPAIREEIGVFTDFPPDDLLDSLVDLYFRNINDFTPLLHEPTFKRGIAEGLHHHNGPFGAMVLLVCANGARFSRDPRIYVDGPEDWKSAGWTWYEQVERERRAPLAPAQLSDLQICVLMALFMQGSRDPHTTWTLIGAGIRMAIDVGAHRRKMYGTTPTVEGELWKRAFWVMVYQEWNSSYGLGRPSSIHPEDMDVALPIEVDDEYWTTPDGAPLFQQPPGKPSRTSFFVHSTRLSQILTFTARTIYSINKSKAHLDNGDIRWEERVVAELDSALNKWSDALPDHLRWDPNCEDLLTLKQTATLRAHYYHTQIAVHRPFMSAARRESPLSFPSLIICSTAARSAIQVLETLYKHTGTAYHRNIGTLYMSSVVFAMNVKGQERSGRPTDASHDSQNIKRCIEMLNAMKHEVHACEILCDLLKKMIPDTNVPASAVAETQDHPHSNTQNHPHSNTASTGKRHRTSTTEPQSSIHGVGSATSYMSHSNAPRQHSVLASLAYTTDSQPLTGISPTAVLSYNPADLTNVTSASTSSLSMALQQPSQAQSQVGVSATTFVSEATQEPNRLSWESEFQQKTGNGLHLLAHGLEQISPWPIVDNETSNTSSTHGYPQSLSSFDPESGTLPPGMIGDGVQTVSAQDFAFMDETMDVWSDAPASFGWDDWKAYFQNDANDRNFFVGMGP